MPNSLFRFPDPVNEVAARAVAAIVVVLSTLYLATGSVWLLAFLAYGFVARVLTGPTLSPVGQIATRIVAPLVRSEPILVPGPPKRFAQGLGATLSVAALAAHLVGSSGVALALVAAITGAAFLESALAYCIGCAIFGRLMALGVVPESICEACADLSRLPASSETLVDTSS